MPTEIQHWNAKILDIANAQVNLKGIITEISAPTLERDFDTEKRAGEAGVNPRPKFFNEVEVSITIRKLFPTFLKAVMEAVNSPITLTASTIIENETTNVNEVYTWFIRGYYSSLPLGDLSADGLEAEITLMANYLEISYGTLAVIYDPANYIYSINGTNLFASIKTSLGL